jgi:transglutaminase-like putative cysteine protease
MDRRTFIKTALVLFATTRTWRALSGVEGPALSGVEEAQPFNWRTFEVTMRVEIQKPSGLTRAWLPLAHPTAEGYQRVLRQSWRGNAPVLRAIRDERAGILFAEWPDGEQNPHVDLTLQVATRDRATDWSNRTPRGAARATLQRYLRVTRLVPVVPDANQSVLQLARREPDDVAKARAIYEWVIENGEGTDANGLFVMLTRVAGVPARMVCGVRVAASRTHVGGDASADAATSPHCRAEFHSTRHGWVPVDPASVRQVMLGPKRLDPASVDVQYARRRLFGSWEGNWVAFNDADDLSLPNSAGARVPFFAFPFAETGGRRLNAGELTIRLTSRELAR